MSKMSCITGVVAFLALSVTIAAEGLLYHPESIVFDPPRERYLVANFDNGDIIAIDSNGIQSTFASLGGNSLGSVIVGDILYITQLQTVIGLDLATATPVFDLTIAPNPYLEGLTSDGSEYLYAVHDQGLIYKIRISDESVTTFTGLFPTLQDLVYDGANNRLLAVAFAAASPIQAVDLDDGTVSTVVTTPFGQFDGITMDNEGYVYVTTHYSNGHVYRYDPDFSEPPFLFASGLLQPTNPHYNLRDSILAVPSMGTNTVSFFVDNYKVDSDSDGIVDAYDNCPYVSNEWQEDADSDGVGDACDNCIDTQNPGQHDNDSDGDGDLCDDDDDNDTVLDSVDNCRFVENLDQTDDDLDSVGNACDNCVDDYNPFQYDKDDDGIGDVCDEERLYIQCCNDMPEAYFNEPFEYQFWAIGGTLPYEWSRGYEQLPDGLELDRHTGVMSGIPSSKATYFFRMIVFDDVGARDTALITMVVDDRPVPPYVCGDADASGEVDIDDVVYLITYIFSGGPPPDPYESGDGDCSGDVDIDDVVWLINYIFAGGNAPCDTDGDEVLDC
jgi:hypothetical protein